MKAKVQYGDFEGTAAADLSDAISTFYGNRSDGLSKYFKLDENRFELVGVDISGIQRPFLILICLDKNQSNDGENHYVRMTYDIEDKKVNLDTLFKRLNIILFDSLHSQLSIENIKSVNYSDVHETETEE
jgi:hypothetical protein